MATVGLLLHLIGSFIDEMQDTSWEQERLLQLMFDETVTVQRFGDINQRILGSSEGAENLTFPRGDVLPISSSKRFGPHIAKSVSRTQLAGTAVTGEAEDRHKSMLIVYSTGRVGSQKSCTFSQIDDWIGSALAGLS